MDGLLVRVAVDQSANGGGWNGPVDSATDEFVYVPIPEQYCAHPGLNTSYSDPLLHAALKNLSSLLPAWLSGRDTHLDPDFGYLTYGDSDSRAYQIQSKLKSGDLLAFYSGNRDLRQPTGQLLYVLICLYVIDAILPSSAVPNSAWHENAHTRRIPCPGKHQIIVRARPKVSGRLEKSIPIGNYRERAYRVYPNLLEKWGGLSVKNGYIQRSARLPRFNNALQFYEWFKNQRVPLVSKNN
jgi:putative DNA base modification enzyme with NMAD domain